MLHRIFDNPSNTPMVLNLLVSATLRSSQELAPFSKIQFSTLMVTDRLAAELQTLSLARKRIVMKCK